MRPQMRTHGMGQVNGRPCKRSLISSIMGIEQQSYQKGKAWNIEFMEGVCDLHNTGI